MTMTRRNALNSILTILDSVLANAKPEDIETIEGCKEYCNNEIYKMNAALEKRSSKPSKASIENAPIAEKIVEALANHGSMIAADISEAISTEENVVSVQKVSAICRQKVEEGVLRVEDIKVKNKGKVKLYSLVTADN